jgi:PAS domain S-box-containing protein
MGEETRTVRGPTEIQEGAFVRAVLDHINDVVIVVAADGTIRYVNAAAEWLLGLRPDEHVGRSVFGFVHPDDVDDAVGALGRSVALGAGPLPRKVLRIRHGDDTWRWVELSSYGLLDDPVVGGFVVTVREVTDRLDAEARFRAMLAHSSDLIVVLDPSGNVRWSSAARTRLLGHSSGETEPENSGADLVHPDDLEEVQDAFGGLLAGTRSFDRPIVARVRAADGAWRSLEMIATNLIDDPNVRGVVVSSRDVTERIDMEKSVRSLTQDLERSNAELDQFASVAAHDLQEPLRTLSGFAQLLRRQHGDQLDAEAQEFIGNILDSATRMQHLINDLLTYSRIGRRELRSETVDTKELVDEVTWSLAAAADEAGAEVVVHSLPCVQADRRQLEQLFQNLISNAIKFRSHDHPRIDVAAVRSGDEWKFSVADDGIGIDPSYAERVFQVFERLHARDQHQGTGIGLAISHRIVERHGGRIWVEPGPDGGSVFSFTLPIPTTSPPA